MAQTARFSSLQAWLGWQETLHPESIELGLARVGTVADRLACCQPAPHVISVAGTNGKGSSVALLEAILIRAGYRVGAYTSPHLFRYNERVHLMGEEVGDSLLCDAFARIDVQRGDISLTYFEFGTLAALDIFSRQSLDVVILEVGLGGRLDAVNIVDADVALITAIGIDHTTWLGNDREAIAREKAGIIRAGRPVVCSDSRCPDALEREAQRVGASLYRLGSEFRLSRSGCRWHWQGAGSSFRDLPLPALPGGHQLANAAGVMQVLELLQDSLPVDQKARAAGLKWMSLPGRIQRISGSVEQVLDVSHNAQAAEALADALRQSPVAGRSHAVLGMMQDKDVAHFLEPLLDLVDVWYATGLRVNRAFSGNQLAGLICDRVSGQSVHACKTLSDALDCLRPAARAGDRVLVCGSFHTVAEWSALNPMLN
jgi:dihydrofolate synthase/folylpolyglutamate synthase